MLTERNFDVREKTSSFSKFSLFIVAFILLFGFSFLHSTQAAAFNDAADGAWNLGATWGNSGNNVAGSGYPGSSDTVTIDSNTVSLAADAAATSVTISGGTLNGGTSTLSIGTGGWTYSSGTFNPQTGTVKFIASLTMTGNTTFNNLTIDPNSSLLKTVTLTGYTATTTGTFTMDNSDVGLITLTGGTVVALGGVSWDASTSNTGDTTVLKISGSGSQTLSVTNASTTSGAFLPISIEKPSGTLVLPSLIRTAKNWTYVSGTIDSATNNSTVVFSGSLVLTGSQTLNNVRFDSNNTTSATYTIDPATTLSVLGNLTVDNTATGTLNFLTGTINSQGSINFDTSNFSNSATVNLVLTGSSDQVMVFSGGTTTLGSFASTTINKTSGTVTVSGIARTSKNFNVLGGAMDWATNGATLSFAGTTNFTPGSTSTYNHIYFDTTGTVTLLGNLSLAGDWTNTGSFVSGTNLVTFVGAATSSVYTGGTSTTKDFQNLTISKTGNGTVQLTSAGLDVDGTLTITSGILDLGGQPISTTATISNSGTLKLIGSESFSSTPTNNSGSTVEYYATTTSTQAIKNWTYQSIKFSGDPNGTFTSASALSIPATLTVTGGTFAPSSSVTVTATTTVSGGVLSAGSATLDFNSDVVISGGVFTAPTSTMTVAGNWNHSAGTFTHNSGTVNFDGNNQIILGANTWNNLTKNAATALTLTFQHGVTQTVTGTLTFQGSLGNPLSLRSDLNTSQWNINPQGSRVLNYLDVKDSNNTNGTAITTNSTSVNSGNNTNWTFTSVDGTPPAVVLLIPLNAATVHGTSTQLSASSTDNVGVVGVQFKLDGSTNIGSEVTSTSSPNIYNALWDLTGVSEGVHTVSAVARDAGGNYSTSTVATITVDNTKPIISSIAASPSGSLATITWSTNEPATSQVYYGTSTLYASSTVVDSTATTTHTVSLTGIVSGSTYHYSVYSADGAGNLATSTDNTFAGGLPVVGLVGWYIAGTGVTASGTNVVQWGDQSGNGNNLTQATSSLQPYSVTDSQGRSVIRFPKNESDVLNIPSSITLNARNQTVWIVKRNVASNQSVDLVTINGYFAGILRYPGGGTPLTLYSSNKSSSFYSYMMPEVIGVVMNSTSTTIHTTASSTASTASTAGSGAGGTIAAVGDIYEVLIYSAPQSPADVANTKAYLIQKYGIPIPSTLTKQILFEGDSITDGILTNTQPYPSQTYDAVGAANGWKFASIGSSGATLTTLTSRNSTVANFYDSSLSRNVLMVLIGRNDLATQNADVFYNNLVTYVQAKKAAGWEVWVGTLIASGIQAKIDEANQRIRGTNGYTGIMADAGADKIVDFAANSVFDSGSQSDLTYYLNDSTHPTNTGSGVMASIISPYFLSSATDTAPVISTIASSTSVTTATVTWNTDIAAASTVTYGTSTAYGSASTSAALVTSHSITLTGLSANTAYHFLISGATSGGTNATSTDQVFTTDTVAAPAPTPVVMLGSSNATAVTSINPPAPTPLVTIPSITDTGCTTGNIFSTQTGKPCPITTLEQPSVPVHTAPTSVYLFTKDLQFGVVNTEVKLLQQYLNTHGFIVSSTGAGSVGKETNTFGSATRAALIRFQKAKGISPASGYFGSLTRRYIVTHN